MARRPWLLSVVSVLVWVAQARATAGDLDPTFGTGGIVTDATVFDAHDVVVLGDGRILVGGSTSGDVDPSAFVLARYTEDGALDTTFGAGGYAVTPIGVFATVQKLLVQPDGKIVAVGYADLVTEDDDSIAVARYDADGAPDATFGTGGVAIHNAAVESLAYDAALQDDGKIVLAGTALTSDYAAFVGRLDADGSLDASFGSGGWVLETGFVGGGSIFNAVLVKADGTIVAAGIDSRFLPSRYLVIRYDAAGARDATFGSGGVVLTDVPGGGGIGGLAFAPGDTIVAAGRAGGFGEMGVVRYLSNGALDPSFGAGTGITTLSIPTRTSAYDVVVGVDGRITVAGYRYVPGTYNDLVAARFLANGTPDAAFGGTGWVAVHVGNNDFGNAIALQDDGKVLVAGTTVSETGMLLARLLDGRCPPTPTSGCKVPLQPFASSVKIRSDGDPTTRRFAWRWKRGAATTLADLGDPTTTDAYALCGYQTSPSGAFLFEASVPSGDGWTHFGAAGFAYRDRAGTADGVTSLKLKSGAAGAASAQATARGASVVPLGAPLSTPVAVQLRSSTGACFTATYDTRITRNDGSRFVARGD